MFFLKKRFRTWKTVKLGTGLKTGDDFRKALKSAGLFFSQEAETLLANPSFSVSPCEIEIELVNVSVGELGFYKRRGARLNDVLKRAQELELGGCPIEVGPQLRLQFLDQPVPKEGHVDFLNIGMVPVVLKPRKYYDSDDNRFIFALTYCHQDDLYLLYLTTTRWKRYESYHCSCRFVFLQRNQMQRFQ